MKATLIVGFALMAAAQAGLGAQDSLSAAKDLYASAAYEDALSTLTRLNVSGSTEPDLARQVDEYRAFCLYALGRTGEAETVAESMIRREPLTKLDTADVSPRLEEMFTNVRKRLLPTLIRERFRTARSEVDQKNFSAAEPHLVEARLMIADAEQLGVNDDGLADLSVLVEGFLQLIKSTAEQRTPPPPAVPGSDTSQSTRPQVQPPPAAVKATSVFTAADDGVSPPVVLDQRVPSISLELLRITKAMKTSMVLDILVDEKGDVVDTIVRKSLNPSFDEIMARAARRWKYRPATKDGAPVRYLKTVVLVP